MSIITERFPQCDRCGEIAAGYQANRLTVKALRKAMKKGGWLFRAHKDICPDCTDAIENNRGLSLRWRGSHICGGAVLA